MAARREKSALREKSARRDAARLGHAWRRGPGPLRRGETVALDIVIALSVAVACGYAALEGPDGPGLREASWLSWLAGLLLGLPLLARRRWPLTVAGVVLVGTGLVLLPGVIPDYAAAPPTAALAWALYSIGAGVPHRRSLAAVMISVGGLGGILLMPTNSRDSPDLAGVALMCLVVAVAWLVGGVVRERRTQTVRATEQLTERAVNNERLRIARELHDIVAHSMSLIAVKAAVANHVADERPQETRDALRIIETTSRAALTDMRRALGVLRAEADLTPAPGLADLRTLAEQASSAGVRVDLTVTGADNPLSEGMALAIYRIVQESLTNVVKHAAPAECRASVTVGPDQILIVVTDDGSRPPTAVGAGQGIIGMRERAALYGGQLTARRRAGGGFTVTAQLPYGAA